jgi:hypothetical protein
MPSTRTDATFSPAAYCIPQGDLDMFGAPDQAAQRDLAEGIAVLPRHIHSLATKGQIALNLPRLSQAVVT